MRKTKTYRLISTPMLALLALLLVGATNGTAAPGDLDLTFSGDGKLTDWLSRGDDSANGVAIQPDGKIVVAGSSWTGLSYDFSLVRYNTDGSLDNAFGTGGKVTTDLASYDHAYSVAIQPDGKIVLAGNSGSRFALARYNPNGSLDNTFGADGKVTTEINSSYSSSYQAYSVAIHTDGKIVAAGGSGDHTEFALVRYNPNGSLDTSFDGDGKVTTDVFGLGADRAYSVAIHANGKIVAAGSGYSTTSAREFFTLVQYNLDGSLDTSFDGDGKVTAPIPGQGQARSVAIQTDGKIVAVGGTCCTSNFSNLVGFRFNTDGSVNGQWATNPTLPGFLGYAYGRSVTVQPDGKIVTVGTISSGQNFGLVLIRLNADLSGDSTFGTNGILIRPLDTYLDVSSAAVQPDRKIVTTGNNASPSDQDFNVLRFNTSGTFDTSFDGDGKVTTDFGFSQGNALYDTAIQPDGKIVAAGGARDDFALLRYNADGSPDTTFGSGTGKVRTDMGSRGDTAHAVAVQPDGKIITAGEILDRDDNGCCFGLARYNTDGSLDSTFSGDGKVSTGFFDGTPVIGGASDIVIQPDGKIVAAGAGITFSPGNQIGFLVIRYNTDGSLDPSFDGDGIVTTPISSYASATAVAIQPDGKIVAAGISGDFYLSGNSFTVVRYNPNGSLDSTFDGDGIVTTLTSQRDAVYASALQLDGKIIVAGSRSINSNETGFALIRYNGDGALDTTFGTRGVVTTQVGLHSGAHAVSLQPNGKIVASGSSSGIGNPGDFAVVRYNANSSLDSTFGGGDGIATADFDISSDNAYGMALDNAGRAVVVGESEGRFAIARFLLGDPTPTCPNPIDCADFFVRQHYQDFLNREPDAGGLAYWTTEISQCGNDAACIHRRRIGVSAAFFIEQEFQETGYFVYRFYKASFSRQPNYTEFTADRSRLIDGTNLEERKQTFADDWVQRPALVAAYPSTMSNIEFVNKLFDSAGLTSPRYDAQRQQEILAMNSGRSRALVLRDVIEIADFKNLPDPNDPRYAELKQISQFNPAFVLMQYFGYLGRNVDAAGYAFWLDVVNNREPNNYRGMVCAFITSSEYQLRFGTVATRSNADCGQ